jgi:hypothetical protein
VVGRVFMQNIKLLFPRALQGPLPVLLHCAKYGHALSTLHFCKLRKFGKFGVWK